MTRGEWIVGIPGSYIVGRAADPSDRRTPGDVLNNIRSVGIVRRLVKRRLAADLCRRCSEVIGQCPLLRKQAGPRPLGSGR
jgi:hypothetical protein